MHSLPGELCEWCQAGYSLPAFCNLHTGPLVAALQECLCRPAEAQPT